MTTFVRNHPEAGASSSGTTIATTLSAEVPIGNTLIATVAAANTGGVATTGISKPGGETASWVKVADEGVTGGDGVDRGELTFWIIRTTVAWASGTTVTATGVTTDARSLAIAEFHGVSTEVISAASTSLNDRSTTPISVTTTPDLRAEDLVIQAGIVQFGTPTETTGGTAPGTRQTIASLSGDSGRYQVFGAAYLIGGTGDRTVTVTAPNKSRGVAIVGLRAENYPPNAPTLTSMAAGGVIDRASINRASHVFSDPNGGDSQSAFDLRYRIVGAGSWTTINVPVPNQFYDFAAGSLAAGDYERQVRTYDALGAVGPWSSSGFFTAADVPAGPSITYPVNGQAVEQNETLVWSTASQDSYQVRRVADSAGSPDTGTVYFDTGEVVEAATRSLPLVFATNGRTEHVQVRVKDSGLWSAWVSVSVDVDYTPPPAPTFSMYADESTASLLIVFTNPAPTGTQPALAYNDIYIDDGDGEERKATHLAANSSWRYWTPKSGRDYATATRVVAVATNGTTASST